MSIHEDKVHADFEIFDDEAPMPQINAALTVTPAAHPSVPGFIPLMAPIPAATSATSKGIASSPSSPASPASGREKSSLRCAGADDALAALPRAA